MGSRKYRRAMALRSRNKREINEAQADPLLECLFSESDVRVSLQREAGMNDTNALLLSGNLKTTRFDVGGPPREAG